MKPLGFVILTVEYRQEEGCWTARCPELGTSMFGETFEEAQEAIREAIHLHLNGLEETGERERFFKEHHIKLYQHRPADAALKLPAVENTAYQALIQPVGV